MVKIFKNTEIKLHLKNFNYLLEIEIFEKKKKALMGSSAFWGSKFIKGL